jgi:hypothetical protein
VSEQEHLYHGPRREHLHYGPGGWLDFRRRRTHFDTGNSFDLLP